MMHKDQQELKSALKEATQTLDGEIASHTEEQHENVAKKTLLSRNKITISIILILGNIAVILLLLFIYFSL